MAITLNLPGRTRTPAAVEPAPHARVAASAAFQWAGSRVDVESLLRLRADWYPRVQRYARNVGIFAAAARDTVRRARWKLQNVMVGAKGEVKVRYGLDSNEVAAIGLKKKSERTKASKPKKADDAK